MKKNRSRNEKLQIKNKSQRFKLLSPNSVDKKFHIHFSMFTRWYFSTKGKIIEFYKY